MEKGDILVIPSWIPWSSRAVTPFDRFRFSDAPIMERLHSTAPSSRPPGAMGDLDQARAALRVRQGSGARHEAASAPADTLALARLGTAYFACKLNELSDVGLVRPPARPG